MTPECQHKLMPTCEPHTIHANAHARTSNMHPHRWHATNRPKVIIWGDSHQNVYKDNQGKNALSRDGAEGDEHSN